MITKIHFNHCKIFYGQALICMICSARTKPSNWKWDVAAFNEHEICKGSCKNFGVWKKGAKLLKTFVGGNLLTCKPILKD